MSSNTEIHENNTIGGKVLKKTADLFDNARDLVVGGHKENASPNKESSSIVGDLTKKIGEWYHHGAADFCDIVGDPAAKQYHEKFYRGGAGPVDSQQQSGDRKMIEGGSMEDEKTVAMGGQLQQGEHQQQQRGRSRSAKKNKSHKMRGEGMGGGSISGGASIGGGSFQAGGHLMAGGSDDFSHAGRSQASAGGFSQGSRASRSRSRSSQNGRSRSGSRGGSRGHSQQRGGQQQWNSHGQVGRSDNQQQVHQMGSSFSLSGGHDAMSEMSDRSNSWGQGRGGQRQQKQQRQGQLHGQLHGQGQAHGQLHGQGQAHGLLHGQGQAHGQLHGQVQHGQMMQGQGHLQGQTHFQQNQQQSMGGGKKKQNKQNKQNKQQQQQMQGGGMGAHAQGQASFGGMGGVRGEGGFQANLGGQRSSSRSQSRSRSRSRSSQGRHQQQPHATTIGEKGKQKAAGFFDAARDMTMGAANQHQSSILGDLTKKAGEWYHHGAADLNDIVGDPVAKEHHEKYFRERGGERENDLMMSGASFDSFDHSSQQRRGRKMSKDFHGANGGHQQMNNNQTIGGKAMNKAAGAIDRAKEMTVGGNAQKQSKKDTSIIGDLTMKGGDWLHHGAADLNDIIGDGVSKRQHEQKISRRSRGGQRSGGEVRDDDSRSTSTGTSTSEGTSENGSGRQDQWKKNEAKQQWQEKGMGGFKGGFHGAIGLGNTSLSGGFQAGGSIGGGKQRKNNNNSQLKSKSTDSHVSSGSAGSGFNAYLQREKEQQEMKQHKPLSQPKSSIGFNDSLWSNDGIYTGKNQKEIIQQKKSPAKKQPLQPSTSYTSQSHSHGNNTASHSHSASASSSSNAMRPGLQQIPPDQQANKLLEYAALIADENNENVARHANTHNNASSQQKTGKQQQVQLKQQPLKQKNLSESDRGWETVGPKGKIIHASGSVQGQFSAAH